MKSLRIAILLLILLFVAVGAWQDRVRTTRWRTPLYVAIYPIAADDSRVTSRYLSALDGRTFDPVDGFFAREAGRYHLGTDQPVKTRVRAAIASRPPGRAAGAGLPGTIWWSLRLRYWAWRVSGRTREPEDVRIFVMFHDPALTPAVPHSLGLEKGLIGVVFAFADPRMNAENAVVIAHEFAHTVGASDKYDAANDAPSYPDGYGDPAQKPLYPQSTAELMAGRRMLTAAQWQQPSSLDEVVIGPATAREIRWLK